MWAFSMIPWNSLNAMTPFLTNHMKKDNKIL